MSSNTEVYLKVAKELNLPIEVVKGVYEGYWWFVRDYIKHLPLKDPNLTEEEFLQLRTSINIPSLGKLTYPLDKFRAIKLRNIYIKSLQNDKDKRD